MANISEQQLSVRDLHERLSLDLMRRAYGDGKNFSAWLEDEDPSYRYRGTELAQLDAFERQLHFSGIHTRSLPERGLFANEFGVFNTNEHTRALGIEWMVRQWRRVKYAGQRSAYVSDDATPGDIMRPWAEAARERFTQLQPAIPISEVVAFTTSITGNTYKALYLNDDATQARMVRVGELGEIPGATLTQGEHAINLYKYGRKIKSSYEALRRVPMDTVAFHIARMAIQAEVDKLETIAGVLINGDGNANTAATSYDLTTLDPDAIAGGMTLKGWLSFKMKATNPYAITHILVREATALQLLLLNIGSANVPLVTVQAALGIGGLTAINPELREGVRYGVTDVAPALKIVGFDSRFAIERVTEIGANITESAKWIENQTDVLVMTEVEGYSLFDSNANKVLDVNA